MVVFKIQNKVSGQNYVGSCRDDIYERWELYVRAAEAGMDFPLYREIRELGEHQFLIEELDFSEDREELKELELFHTIELAARSLRSHKFDIKDAVVKRCSKTDMERAWMKDLPPKAPEAIFPTQSKAKPKTTTKTARAATPEEKVIAANNAAFKRDKAAAKLDKAAAPKPEKTATPVSVSPPRPLPSRLKLAESSTAPIQPSAAVIQSATQSGQRPDKTSSPKPELGSGRQPAATADSQELEKAVFVEGISLLVRSLSSAEQLSRSQQQAHQQSLNLNEALAESERALRQLEGLQQQAAIRAQAAIDAVQASQAANAALFEVHRRLKTCSNAVLATLEQSREASASVAPLQGELQALLGRLKGGGAEREAPVSAAPVIMPISLPLQNLQPAAPVEKLPVDECVPISAPKEADADEPGPEAIIIEAEQAKMVNRLKQLSELLPTVLTSDAVDALAEGHEAEAGGEGADMTMAFPATESEPLVPMRAWVAASEGEVEPMTLPEQTVDGENPTVVHRRTKRTPSVSASGSVMARPPLLSSRKTLSIKCC